MSTITAKKAKPRNGDRITLHFSALPGKTYGPYPWNEAIGQAEFAALLSRLDARSLILDALVDGEATAETNNAT